MKTLDRQPSTWLLLGAALLVASQLRFGMGVLAWVAPLPFLRYLRLRGRLRDGVWVALAIVAAWVVAVAKIVTAPLPLAAIFGFGLPIGAMLAWPYLAWHAAHRHLPQWAGPCVFAGLMVTSEWLLHSAMPFGTWGAAGNTQFEHLGLMQLASVTGVHGVSFLVYLVSASLELSLAQPDQKRVAIMALGLTGAVAALGELRASVATAHGERMVRVATVDTEAVFSGLPLPEGSELERVDAVLFDRTRDAARAGARLVVWPEAATLVFPAAEALWRERVGALARELSITLAAGHVVLRSTEPLLYENQYALFSPEGVLAHVYQKHHPVPGEPAVRGEGPVAVFASDELGRVSGAICYDEDFPEMALAHAHAGADLVVVPSSDWRGIDPIHAQMATVRAIEGGHALIRATRFGLSIAVDGYGRGRGWHSAFDAPARTMVADVPARGLRTVYRRLGDVFVWLDIAATAFALAYAARPWRRLFLPLRAAPSSTPADDAGSTPGSSSSPSA
jgi:apolipoprotein N-acyltransferase